MEESGNRFSLIDEPWIPVVDVGRVSLKQVFSDPQLRTLGGNALQKIALMKMLQAICQAAVTPENDKQWREIGADGLCFATLNYLEKWHDRFWLYGERPFLQMPAIVRAEIKPFGAVLPEVSTGNTTVLTQGQCEKPMSDADKALLVVVQMSMALGGKKTDNSVVLTTGYTGKTNNKGKSATGKPGSALAFMGLMHSFCMGSTLRETLWLNLFSTDDIAGLTQYPAGLGRAPWEMMPEGEDCPVARELKRTLMGRLVPVGRFCLLAKGGLHYSEGISHCNYKEGLYDPSVLINKKGKELKVQWTDPSRRPWRELTSLLAFLQVQGAEWECEQLRIAVTKLRQTKISFGIWSGGLRVSSNAGEQYVSGSDDLVESLLWLDPDELNLLWFSHFQGEMTALDLLAKRLYGGVSNWCREMKVEPKPIAALATELFWQLCEHQAQDLIENCTDPDVRQRLRWQFSLWFYQAFDTFCPHESTRQLDAWARNRPGVADYLEVPRKEIV